MLSTNVNKDDWHRKVHDKSNQLESMNIKREQDRSKADFKNTLQKQKKQYFQDLSSQKQVQNTIGDFERNKLKSALSDGEAFKFE